MDPTRIPARDGNHDLVRVVKDACDEMELCKTRMDCSQACTVVVLELVSRASVERTL